MEARAELHQSVDVQRMFGDPRLKTVCQVLAVENAYNFVLPYLLMRHSSYGCGRRACTLCV